MDKTVHISEYPARFFMGANTPSGFVAYLDDLYKTDGSWRVFLIKSGPGTGKASLMRAVLERLSARGTEAVSIICSSDPDSLDGVIFPSLKACIIDATAPHIIEPKFWGAVERIVDVSSCMDADALFSNAAEIIAATSENSALHVRGRKFIGAAASLLGDTYRMASTYTDREKTLRTAARIAVREFGPKAEHPGRQIRYFLSAVTPGGLVTLHDTLISLCPRIYSIEDDYGASSRILTGELCRRALEAGHDVISCADPLFPAEGPEHLLIPSIGVGFTTSNHWHKADFPVFRRIHAARFMDTDSLRSKKPLMSFNRRAARELLNEAVLIAQEAKKVHDRLETLYTKHMDWNKVDRLTKNIIESFEKIANEAKPEK